MTLYEQLVELPDTLLPGLKEKNYPLSVAWREVCHVVGSVILIVATTFLAPFAPFNLPIAVFAVLVVFMTYQEFYLHPKKYQQRLWKGILDWLAWVLPFALFLILM
ncbi:MAG: hypothetical protein ABA06_03600 [Parcubacteria bacterium C7867-001]|nr:MAG: hypothetical protein ABA06_03600 [Parcubacteria bacterium C7867-001]